MICIKSPNIVELFNKVSSTCLKLTAPNVWLGHSKDEKVVRRNTATFVYDGISKDTTVGAH